MGETFAAFRPHAFAYATPEAKKRERWGRMPDKHKPQEEKKGDQAGEVSLFGDLSHHDRDGREDTAVEAQQFRPELYA